MNITVQVSGTSVKLAKKISKITLGNSDEITSVSDSLAKNATRIFASKKSVAVIPNGVNEQFFSIKKNSMSPTRRNILFIGRLHKSKGVDILIEAVSIVKKEFSDIRLTIVGSGSIKDSLITKAKKLNLEQNILFTGETDHLKLPNFFKAADILVLPSRREGFGVVLIEAMASGLPVIGTDTGGISEIIQDNYNGYKFKVNDSKRLSFLISNLLKDDSLYEIMSSNARNYAKENYSISLVSKRYFDLYRSMITRHG